MEKADKTFYDRKIVYLDYLEDGEKIKNGGFVKWDVRGEDCRIQIHIRGLYTTDTLQGEIKLISREDTYGADRIGLQFGTGEYASRWKSSDLAGTGISYTECDGILIKLSDSRELKGQWRERAREEGVSFRDTANQSVEAEEVHAEAVSISTLPIETLSTETLPTETAPTESLSTDMISTETVTEAISAGPLEAEIETKKAESSETQKADIDAMPEQEIKNQTQKMTNLSDDKMDAERTSVEEELPEENKTVTNFPLSQNKWEQLERIYPKIHPFGDGREYLSVTPRDFVVLPRQYQELVQNSFLLHGYYNYGHLILTKIVEAEEERYYLGVPGAYYDREKQAALMFGFEGFEAGNDKMEDGGFGYYMKRVEI